MALNGLKHSLFAVLPIWLIASIIQYVQVSENNDNSIGTVYYLYLIPLQLMLFFYLQKSNQASSNNITISIFLLSISILIGYIGVWVVYFVSGGQM